MRVILLGSVAALACGSPGSGSVATPPTTHALSAPALSLPPTREGALGAELERVWDSGLRGECAPLLLGDELVIALQPRVVAEPDLSPRDYPGSLATLDRRNGRILWQKRLAGWLVGCPVLTEGVVVAADGTATLQAFDVRTGDVLWSQYVAGLWGGLAAAGTRVFGSSSKEAAIALDIRTGRRVWTTPWTSPPTTGPGHAPVWMGSTLYALASVGAQGAAGSWVDRSLLIALDPSTGARRWERLLDGSFNEPLLHAWGSDVYLVSDRPELVVLGAATGELREKRPLGDPSRGRAAMLFDRGALYVSDLDAQRIGRFELTSGREAAALPFLSVPRRMFARGEVLLVDGDDGLHAFRLPSGEPTWHLPTDQGSGPVLWQGDVLYFPGWAVALRAHSLALKLALGRSSIGVDEALELRATFVNVRPNGELTLGAHLLEQNLVRALEIRDKDGHLLTLREPAPPNAPVRAREHYRTLAAGREWTVTWSVPVGPKPYVEGRGFWVDGARPLASLPPGEYELVAVYENAEDTAAELDPVYGPRVTTVPGVWKGRVRSDPVPFRIVPPAADAALPEPSSASRRKKAAHDVVDRAFGGKLSEAERLCQSEPHERREACIDAFLDEHKNKLAERTERSLRWHGAARCVWGGAL
ncbi:MAG TPA: PQQ-binding-like beta-propeller repeat protein [Polyangiaceae bacterium]|nr:PQQ-binding-like beta-propeller repeat protein [Polyangiaceae bacterium]